MISHGSEGREGGVEIVVKLHIKVISHGSEGKCIASGTRFLLHIKVISHGSEGMDMRSAVKLWRVEKEGYFVKWTYYSSFMVWFIDFI